MAIYAIFYTFCNNIINYRDTMTEKKLTARERLDRLKGIQAKRAEAFKGKTSSIEEIQKEPGSGFSKSTRAALESFDEKEAELYGNQTRMMWANWHGISNYDKLEALGRELAALPEKEGYYRTLARAVSEAGTDSEKREAYARQREALYNAVVRDPRLMDAREKAHKELDSFRFEFSGQELVASEMVSLWQSLSESEPVLSRAIYMEYLRQSASLRQISLDVARAANMLSAEAGEKVGIKIRTFADVILARNEMAPIDFKSRVGQLLQSVQNMGEFLDQIAESAGVRASPLNDLRLVSQFLANSGVLSIYPQSFPGNLGYFKHILDMCGYFGEVHGEPYLDLESFGQAPYSIDLELGLAAGSEEGALRYGKGNREYVAGINPGTKQDPRQYLAALAHEIGHVLHYDGMDRSEGPRFFKTDTEAFREGMALVVESLISDPRAIAELGDFSRDDANLVYLTSKFLDNTRMRDFAIRGMTELALYTMEPDDVGEIYAQLLREFPVSPNLDVSDKLLGNSWGAAITMATRPGAAMEYAMAYSIASPVLSSLSVMGGGSPVSQTTATMMAEYCYTGFEVPWRKRLRKMLEDTGQIRKPLAH